MTTRVSIVKAIRGLKRRIRKITLGRWVEVLVRKEG